MIATAPFRRRRYLGQEVAAAVSPQVDILKSRGALLEVQIGVPASVASGIAARGGAVPTPKTLVAMIDTGASITAVVPSVANAIGLVQTGAIQLGGIGGTSMRPVYAASMGFGDPSIPKLDPIQIAGADLPTEDFHVLIGRDVLKYLVLNYDGPRGMFSLAPGGNAPPPSTAPYVQPVQPAEPSGIDVGDFPTTLVVVGVGIGLLNILDVF